MDSWALIRYFSKYFQPLMTKTLVSMCIFANKCLEWASSVGIPDFYRRLCLGSSSGEATKIETVVRLTYKTLFICNNLFRYFPRMLTFLLACANVVGEHISQSLIRDEMMADLFGRKPYVEEPEKVFLIDQTKDFVFKMLLVDTDEDKVKLSSSWIDCIGSIVDDNAIPERHTNILSSEMMKYPFFTLGPSVSYVILSIYGSFLELTGIDLFDRCPDMIERQSPFQDMIQKVVLSTFYADPQSLNVLMDADDSKLTDALDDISSLYEEYVRIQKIHSDIPIDFFPMNYLVDSIWFDDNSIGDMLSVFSRFLSIQKILATSFTSHRDSLYELFSASLYKRAYDWITVDRVLDMFVVELGDPESLTDSIQSTHAKLSMVEFVALQNEEIQPIVPSQAGQSSHVSVQSISLLAFIETRLSGDEHLETLQIAVSEWMVEVSDFQKLGLVAKLLKLGDKPIIDLAISICQEFGINLYRYGLGSDDSQIFFVDEVSHRDPRFELWPFFPIRSLVTYPLYKFRRESFRYPSVHFELQALLEQITYSMKSSDEGDALAYSLELQIRRVGASLDAEKCRDVVEISLPSDLTPVIIDECIIRARRSVLSQADRESLIFFQFLAHKLSGQELKWLKYAIDLIDRIPVVVSIPHITDTHREALLTLANRIRGLLKTVNRQTIANSRSHAMLNHIFAKLLIVHDFVEKQPFINQSVRTIDSIEVVLSK
jgi:hypothetical protein